MLHALKRSRTPDPALAFIWRQSSLAAKEVDPGVAASRPQTLRASEDELDEALADPSRCASADDHRRWARPLGLEADNDPLLSIAVKLHGVRRLPPELVAQTIEARSDRVQREAASAIYGHGYDDPAGEGTDPGRADTRAIARLLLRQAPCREIVTTTASSWMVWAVMACSRRRSSSSTVIRPSAQYVRNSSATWLRSRSDARNTASLKLTRVSHNACRSR
jgi:hypothetical protein